MKPISLERLIGYVAAVVLGLALAELGADIWAIIAAGLALIGVMTRSGVLPHFVVMVVALGLLSIGPFRRPALEAELTLAAALVAYMIGQFRDLESVGRVPSADDARSWTRTIIAGTAAVLLPRLIWALIPTRPTSWGLTPWGWRLIVLAWLGGLAGLVVALYFTWRDAESQSPAEAELYLRDEFWTATRSDQRRIHRWRQQEVRTARHGANSVAPPADPKTRS